MDVLKIMAIVGCGSGLLLIVELIRRGRLKEKYSLLWLFAGTVLLVFASSRGLLEYVSSLVGIYYPPSFLFLLAFLFLLMITLHFSSVISGLSEKNKQLAQELALLRLEMVEGKGRTMDKHDAKD
ncbi:MAG: DUF2304 domain-containing protein [Nitrospirae bacterium]|nr:DUF2304 domain-containing protein [Nitrospirota bacterium]